MIPDDLDLHVIAMLSTEFGEFSSAIPALARELHWPCGEFEWQVPIQFANAMLVNPSKCRPRLEVLHREEQQRLAEQKRLADDEKRRADQAARELRQRQRDEELARRKLEEQERFLAEREKRKARAIASFRRTIPSNFLHVCAERSPRPSQFKFVENFWLADEHDDFSGLILCGRSGSGKTSAAFALWLRQASDDWCVANEWRRTVEFVRLCKSRHLGREIKAEFDAELHAIRDCEGVVYLDDFGTERFAETSAEEVLFDIIDYRTSWQLKTIISTNYSPEDLSRMFSAKNAEKILRRLNQFFLRVDFDRA